MRSCDELSFLLCEGMEVAFVPPQTDCPRTAQVISVEAAKGSSRLIYFDTVRDIATAEALVGCSCLVKREALPQGFDTPVKKPYEGFDVHDAVFGFLGKVKEVVENPAQRLLVVENQEEFLLVPFVDEFVEHIDEDAQHIAVTVPQGLLDLAQENKAQRRGRTP